MKKKLIKASTRILQKNNYSDDEIEVIVYGLEGLYLTLTKLIVILAISIIFKVTKEVVFLLISYNIIRSQAFGIHASKSIYCLISSLLFFIGGAIICKYVTIPFNVMIVISLICDICLLAYAPADTYKRPIIQSKRRKKFKLFSFALGLIYTVLIIIHHEQIISSYLLVGMIEAVLMILPITYNIFKMPYNNYKTYYSDVKLVSNN